MKITEHQNVGKVKYLVSYHDGTKFHKDGSEFFDIATFRNKKKKDAFITQLAKGCTHEIGTVCTNCADFPTI